MGCFTIGITNNSGSFYLSCCGSHFSNVWLESGFEVVLFFLMFVGFLQPLTQKCCSMYLFFWLIVFNEHLNSADNKKWNIRLVKDSQVELYDCSFHSQDSTGTNFSYFLKSFNCANFIVVLSTVLKLSQKKSLEANQTWRQQIQFIDLILWLSLESGY